MSDETPRTVRVQRVSPERPPEPTTYRIVSTGDIALKVSAEQLEILERAASFLVEEHIDESPEAVGLLGEIRKRQRQGGED
jgi:hypothetical protein